MSIENCRFITPILRSVESGSRFNVISGVGYYRVGFTEFHNCENICSRFNELFVENRIGGFVGVEYESVPRSWGSFLLRIQSHFVDFGQVDELGTGAEQLDAPILMFQVGA